MLLYFRLMLKSIYKKRLFFPFFSVAAGLALWEALSRAAVIPPVVFPPPSRVLLEFAAPGFAANISSHLLWTLAHAFPGFLFGALAGVAAGLLCGFSPVFNSAIDPWVNAAYPLPKIALIIPLMALFGIGHILCIVLVAMTVFFNVLIPVRAGVLRVDASLLNAAVNLGASRIQVVWKVVIPYIFPYVFTGLHIGLLTAFTATIVIEMLLSSQGLGRMLWMSSSWLKMEMYYAYVAVTAVLGMIMIALLRKMRGILLPWAEEADAG